MPEIWFPNLGIEIDHLSRTAFTVFGQDIYWYGIFIGLGVILGVLLALHEAKRTGQNPDTYLDFIIYAMIIAIIGARLYYVIFSWDFYSQHPEKIFAIREGGLAIYGGIIGGVLTAIVYSHLKKKSFWVMADTMAPSLILGQMLGRWGNFFNQEAFGCNTTLPWGMYSEGTEAYLKSVQVTLQAGVTVDPTAPVHPTFLYESIWCLVGFAVLASLYKKRRFNGQIFLGYIIWYGLGRAWIEGLRTDSLYLFHWTLFGQRIRVSQALSLVMVLVCAGILVYQLKVKKADGANLFVKRVQQTTEAEEAAAEPTAPDEKQ